jgi:uncharacterized LabA/DUF88 family protein
MKVGLFIDSHSLYFDLKRTHNKKLSIPKLLEYCKDIGDLVIKQAYGIHVRNEAHAFEHYMRCAGFTTLWWSLKLKERDTASLCPIVTIDMMRCMDKLDTYILCTSDPNFIHVINHLIDNNKNVIVIGAQVPDMITRSSALTVKIPTSWLGD